jgi:hypothetical protein
MQASTVAALAPGFLETEKLEAAYVADILTQRAPGRQRRCGGSVKAQLPLAGSEYLAPG